MSDSAFPLIYEIAGHRRCYLVEPGTELAVGSGADCQIKLEWEGVSELEATLKVVDHSSVNIAVPGQADVAAPLPLTLAVGGHELSFSRPQDMAGWTEPAADNECTLNIGKGGGQSITCKMQSSRPLLIGTDSRCDVVLDSIECPGVVLALWAQGAGNVWVQILDNSAPVDWEARGEALEGATSLPMSVSIGGRLITIKEDASSVNAGATKVAEMPPMNKADSGRRTMTPVTVAVGLGLAAMLIVLGAIQFLNSQGKKAASSTKQEAIVSVPNNGKQPTTDSVSNAPAAVTSGNASPDPVPNKGPTTVAVLEFENSSKKEDMEPLRKGLRDMMMTDLSQVSAIKMVERARLNDLMQEMKLTDGQFIDPATAAKLGKGLAATAVLTGSYIVLGDNIRIDARLVKVESGEVILAEQISGVQADFFTLQKVLAEKLVNRLEVKATAQEQLALRRPQTANFEAFASYSRGVMALELGDKSRARIQLADAVKKDASFKLATNALGEIEKEAKKKLALLDQQITDTTKSVQERFDSQFAKYRVIADAPSQLSGEQLAAHIIVAAHYGLRGLYADEHRHLYEYAKMIAKAFKEQKGEEIYESVRSILIPEVYALSSIVSVEYLGSPGETFTLKAGTGSSKNDKSLLSPAFSLLPPATNNAPSQSAVYSLISHIHNDKTNVSNRSSRNAGIVKFASSIDNLEFPSIWALAAVQADLSDMDRILVRNQKYKENGGTRRDLWTPLQILREESRVWKDKNGVVLKPNAGKAFYSGLIGSDVLLYYNGLDDKFPLASFSPEDQELLLQFHASEIAEVREYESKSDLKYSGICRREWMEGENRGNMPHHLDCGSRFNSDAFVILSDILQSYTPTELDKFPLWKQDWHRAASLAIVSASQVTEVPKSSDEVVIATLRYIDVTSDDLDLKKRANETLLKLTQIRQK